MPTDQSNSLNDELADLKVRESELRASIKLDREKRRREQAQRQAELGLAPVVRPRKDNRFVSSMEGETLRVTVYLPVELLREVRELAGRCGWSVSATVDRLVGLGLRSQSEATGDRVPTEVASVDRVSVQSPVERESSPEGLASPSLAGMVGSSKPRRRYSI
jgi:hypothetical protein